MAPPPLEEGASQFSKTQLFKLNPVMDSPQHLNAPPSFDAVLFRI